MTSNALEVRQSKHRSLRHYLSQENIKSNLAMALPEHMKPDRMIRVALTAVNRNPLLLECTQASIAAGLITCSEMGLEPNGRDIHLVPFKDTKKGTYEVVVIPDYKGLAKLAYQSDMVASAIARAVRAKDIFEYEYGTNAYLKHTPADIEDRGPLVYAWAMVQLKGGGSPFIVLNRAEVMEHKKASRGAGSSFSPWNRPETEPAMWAKTAFRELSKWIPLSPRLERAVQHETDQQIPDADIIDVAQTKIESVVNGEQPVNPPPAATEENAADKVTETSPSDDATDYDKEEQRLLRVINSLQAINKVRDVVKTFDSNDALTDAARQRLQNRAIEREGEIRRKRGARSNGGEELFQDTPTEAGV